MIAGYGYVGEVLATRLSEAGREVWALRRSPIAAPSGVRVIEAEVERADLGREPIDVCYLLAPGEPTEAAYRRAYLEGLDALARRGSLKRLVFASSTAVYASDAGWVDETSPTEPDGFSGRVLLEAEALAATVAEEAVVLRLGGIYGPGRDRTVRRVCEGVAIAPREGPAQYGNRIHRDDAAAAFAHLLAVGRGCYLGVDDDPADLATVEAWLCQRLGVSCESLKPGASRQRGGSKRAKNRRLRASGLELSYPTFREGYEALLAEVR